MAARDIFRNGLDAQNPALVQLLGLCPLLAVSTSAGSALGLGLATLAVLVASNLIASVLGRWLLPEIRLAVFVLTIAGAVTAVELSLAAWWPGLHDSLGIFLPLIVTNCLVLARAEAFASRQPIGAALLDAVAMGLGFLLVLLALGSARELLGRGSLGADLGLLLGGDMAGSGIQILPAGHGLLLALLPPGAFVLLGLMLAARNWRRQEKSLWRRHAVAQPRPTVPPHERPARACDLRAAARTQSAPENRTRVRLAVRAAGRRHPLRTGHGQERERRHTTPVRGREHAAGDPGPRRGRARDLREVHRPVPGQGEEHHRDLSPADR